MPGGTLRERTLIPANAIAAGAATVGAVRTHIAPALSPQKGDMPPFRYANALLICIDPIALLIP